MSNFGKSTSTPINLIGEHKMTVLVVDDIETNLLVLEGYLEPYDAHILRAMDGKKAVEIYQNANINLIMMDIQMPLVDGFEATKMIRRYEAEQNIDAVPIIATTAHIGPADQHLCIRAGMNDYLHKPINLKDVENSLKIWAPQLMTVQAA